MAFAQYVSKNPNAAAFTQKMNEHKYKILSKQVTEYLKQKMSAPTVDSTQEFRMQALVVEPMEYAREYLPQFASKSSPIPTKKAPQPQKAASTPRPKSGEMVQKEVQQSHGLLNRLKDRWEQFRLDYHYAGLAGALGISKGSLFLRKDYNSTDFKHVKTFDMNRYPAMTIGPRDYTFADKVTFPAPETTYTSGGKTCLDLRGCKFKGNLNLSAYDIINLDHADLSQVKELDLSGCKDINLEGLDLSHIKLKLPQPMGKDVKIRLCNTVLPKMEKLDLSQANLFMEKTDMSQVGTVVMPHTVNSNQITGWPKHIDASQCQWFEANSSDMQNVETIIPPSNGIGTNFQLLRCNLPHLKTLDLSNCDRVWIEDNDMPALEDITLGMSKSRQGHVHNGCMCNNRVPALKEVRLSQTPMQSYDDRKKMFETYKNITKAVKMGQNVYKDAETGKLCPLTENQKKAVEIIENATTYGNDGLKGLWSGMASYYYDPKQLTFMGSGMGNMYKEDKTSQRVLTEYNKVLSQALGLKSYINMETLSYEQTPPLKPGEKVNIPPFNQKSYDNISRLNQDYDKSCATAYYKGASPKMEKPQFDKWGRQLHTAPSRVQTGSHSR